MDDKTQVLNMLRIEFDRWGTMLSGLSEAQITAAQLPSNLSIKDVIAHLMVWQQRSIERLEAGLQQREPAFPVWPQGLDPEAEDDVDQVNAWIYKSQRDRPWADVYRDWRSGCQHLLELGQAVPEKDLLDPQRYPWLKGLPLIDVLEGSYDHHHREHLEPLQAWLAQHGDIKTV